MYYLLVFSFFFYVLIDASKTTTCKNPNGAADSVVKVVVTTIDSQVALDSRYDRFSNGEPEKAIVWLGPDNTTVFLVTTGGYLWRSVDSGRNWATVNLEATKGVNYTEGVKSVQLTGDGKSVVVIGNGNNWWTLSNGQFVHSMSPGLMEDVKFHPHQPGWLLALKGCSSTFGCTKDLYLSQDNGEHWVLIRPKVTSADWNSDSVDDMFVVAWEGRDLPLVFSTTFFRSDGPAETVVAKKVLGYKTVGKKIFIALNNGTSLALYVSDNSGITFNPVRFPGGLQESRYSILDITEGSTFINVQHDQLLYTSWGNLYSSNSVGSDFVLSLTRNVRNVLGKCDFKAIAGLEGIYIANRYEITTGEDDTGSGKQTMVTYDMGGKWDRLPKPQGFPCESTDPEDCKLNLLGTSDGNTWYTRKEAIGLVLATGSPSRYLLNRDNTVGVYMSRDAGWTWKYVTSGRYTYEIGNRGAILLLMINDHATGTLKYSLDEGDTWIDCIFAEGEDQIQVKEIVSDPSMQSGMFLAYGNKGDQGILISIDFTEIHEQDCKGYDTLDTPDASKSDYEYWEPSDSRSNNECLLGRRLTFIRRKQSAKCLNPQSFQNTDPKIVKNCSCTNENYECDYCHISVGNLCILDPECQDYSPIPHNCQGTYMETQGYRRVPGDTCDFNSGLNLMPIEKNCPNSPIPPPTNNILDSSGRGPLVAFLIITMLLLFLVGMWIFSGYNDNLRQLLSYVVPKNFLPEFRSKSTMRYTPLDTQLGDDDLEEDAPEIDVDKSDSENPGSVI